MLDAYSGMGIPEELLTIEFFSDVQAVSIRVAANIIMDSEADSDFASNVLASFRHVFGRVSIKDLDPNGDSYTSNVMVTNWDLDGSAEWNGRGDPARVARQFWWPKSTVGGRSRLAGHY